MVLRLTQVSGPIRKVCTSLASLSREPASVNFCVLFPDFPGGPRYYSQLAQWVVSKVHTGSPRQQMKCHYNSILSFGPQRSWVFINWLFLFPPWSDNQIANYFFKRCYLFIFRERGKEGEREGKHWCERETSTGCLSYTSRLGTEPATRASALTWNQTSDLLLCRTTSNQLSHTAQGKIANYIF